MSTINLDAANFAVLDALSDEQAFNDRIAGPSSSDTLRELNGQLDSDNVPALGWPEAALNRRLYALHAGYAATTRPQDYKQDNFAETDKAELIPGATSSFTLTETRDVVVYWSVTYSSIRQTARFTTGHDTDANNRMFLLLDGEQLDHTVRQIPISHGAWVSDTGGTGSGTIVPINDSFSDTVLSRGRTWTGHRVLKNLAAGEHSFGIGAWIRGDGTVRVHSAQMWALIRRF
jgi:hypothetical protein